ncbi:MAG TPA: S-adenosylmethionine:tRNA ribosyltransferase-isomerase [Thermoanaerobaculia bacterium]|nr:S-adenosylmethionine:tRNA ribosyltransferase-isomerase [Thermoanaerobaculia bacterium]
MTTVDFVLPPELEAREPAELRGSGRDDVRLLVTRRDDDSIVHAHFRELPRFLDPGDLVVLNETATLPSALTTAEGVTLHVSTPLPGGQVVVEPRGGAAGFSPPEGVGGLKPAAPRFALPGNVTATLLAPYRDSKRLWVARIDVANLREYLMRFGRPITYSYIDRRFGIDAYQTVYAREPGSAEMPSAGRAFTRGLLVCLRRRGVRLAKLVLHSGVASLETHERPYEEYYEVPQRTADEVRRAKARGGRVVAVGTTVVRALETTEGGAGRGWTDLVITPERGVKVVDALLTGFHEPRATHLAMLEAIAGREHVDKAYDAALRERYLWHEFGDLHLIV